jgi:hypothetical protein
MTGKTHVPEVTLESTLRHPPLRSEQHVALTNITMEYLALLEETTGNCLRDERLFKERRKYVTLEQIVNCRQCVQWCLRIHKGPPHIVLQNEQILAYLVRSAVAQDVAGPLRIHNDTGLRYSRRRLRGVW